MTVESEAADLLEAGADIIRTYGHHKGDYWALTSNERVQKWDGEPVCAVGSMYACQNQGLVTFGEWSPAFLAATNALHAKVGNGKPVTYWNDEPERTAEEVVDLMLEVAKDFRNGEA